MATTHIALTASMRSNLLSLKSTQTTFNSTQDKLSTGYKVNGAMDNPSSYFTAQTLNSRASDLSTLLDGIGQAISTLEVADKGISTLQSIVEQAKTVANSARDTQNVASKITTAQKFDVDKLRVQTIENQISDLKSTDELIIRSGKSTELVGTNTISEDTLVSTVFTTTAAFTAATTSGATGTGGNGSIKIGKEEFFLDFKTGVVGNFTQNRMVETTAFKAGDRLKIIDSSTLSQTIVEDSNGKRHYINLAADTALDSSCTDLTKGTELICTAATTISNTIYDDATAEGQDFTKGSWKVAQNGNGAFGAEVKTESAIQFKDGLTIGQMTERLEYFIGKDKVNITFEDGNLAIRSLNTASVEVKDAIPTTDETPVTGTGFADKFGLDKGVTIKAKYTTTTCNETAESLRQKIDALEGITAEFDDTGHIVIRNENGDDMVMSGRLAQHLGIDGAVTNGSNERDVYSKQFNNLLTQMNELVNDAAYKGINLLNGDSLTVNFNESRTSSITLKGVTFDANGLGLTKAANRWVDNASIDSSLAQITKATSLLRSQASEFGQNLSTVQIREDFTQNMINNLQSGADKLVLADMNEEAANLLSLQTRQQLGLNSLSLASQASQGVLSLF